MQELKGLTVRVQSVWSGMQGSAFCEEPSVWTITWDDGDVDTGVMSLLDPDFVILEDAATTREP